MHRLNTYLALALVVLCAACAPNEPRPVISLDIDAGPTPDLGPADDMGGPAPDDRVHLTPVQHLLRASMALRGVRPSVEEMRTVRDTPDALPGIIDTYLETPAFGATIRDMHNEDWMVRSFFFWYPPLDPFAEMTFTAFNESVQEAPLRLVEHVVMNDRPYTEIVTADYTLADGVVAGVWGMEYDGDGETWIETRYPEANRPHAGILTDSVIMTRHYTTPLNAQRSRAHQFTKALLCFDFLDRSIDVGGNVDLSDPDAVTNAVRSPACASCHQALDPIAANFWTYELFIFPIQVEGYPFTNYKPEYINYRPHFTDRNPGFFGTPTEDRRRAPLLRIFRSDQTERCSLRTGRVPARDLRPKGIQRQGPGQGRRALGRVPHFPCPVRGWSWRPQRTLDGAPAAGPSNVRGSRGLYLAGESALRHPRGAGHRG
jgi:hypothetical protein